MHCSSICTASGEPTASKRAAVVLPTIQTPRVEIYSTAVDCTAITMQWLPIFPFLAQQKVSMHSPFMTSQLQPVQGQNRQPQLDLCRGSGRQQCARAVRSRRAFRGGAVRHAQQKQSFTHWKRIASAAYTIQTASENAGRIQTSSHL